MQPGIDVQETARTQARYNRIAPIYDLMETFAEMRFSPWRRELWSLVPAGRALEVGVGTGKNLPHHPYGLVTVGIDLSDRMLERARRRAARLGHSVDLAQMDVQELDFPADSFDTAVATFAFCSVPDPVRGLRELGRVVKPGGRILLLEHVRVNRPAILGKLMDLLDPLIVRIVGAHINRTTVENAHLAGLEVEWVEKLAPLGLVKLVFARPPAD